MQLIKLSLCGRILKDNIFARKLPVHCSKCLQLVFSVVSLLRVQENLQNHWIRQIKQAPTKIRRWILNSITNKTLHRNLLQLYLNRKVTRRSGNKSYVYLHDLGSINSIPHTLSNDLSRQYNILQHCFMNSSKSSAAWTLNSRALLWWPQNPPGGNQDNILQVLIKLKRINKKLKTWYKKER